MFFCLNQTDVLRQKCLYLLQDRIIFWHVKYVGNMTSCNLSVIVNIEFCSFHKWEHMYCHVYINLNCWCNLYIYRYAHGDYVLRSLSFRRKIVLLLWVWQVENELEWDYKIRSYPYLERKKKMFIQMYMSSCKSRSS